MRRAILVARHHPDSRPTIAAPGGDKRDKRRNYTRSASLAAGERAAFQPSRDKMHGLVEYLTRAQPKVVHCRFPAEPHAVHDVQQTVLADLERLCDRHREEKASKPLVAGGPVDIQFADFVVECDGLAWLSRSKRRRRAQPRPKLNAVSQLACGLLLAAFRSSRCCAFL